MKTCNNNKNTYKYNIVYNKPVVIGVSRTYEAIIWGPHLYHLPRNWFTSLLFRIWGIALKKQMAVTLMALGPEVVAVETWRSWWNMDFGKPYLHLWTKQWHGKYLHPRKFQLRWPLAIRITHILHYFRNYPHVFSNMMFSPMSPLAISGNPTITNDVFPVCAVEHWKRSSWC